MLFTAILVFLGAFLFDVIQVPESPESTKEPPNELEHPSGSFEVPDQGMHTIIGQSKKKVKNKFGQPDRMEPSAYGYKWWVYNKDARHYLQIGIEDGEVVTIFALGDQLQTDPFPITKKAKDVLKGVSLNSDISLTYKGGSYQFELAEKDLNTRPLIQLGDTWAILYFDQFTQKLQGIRYLNTKTFITIKPYSLTYQGSPVKAKKLDQKAWKKVEDGQEQQIFDMTNILRSRFDLESVEKSKKAAKTAYGHSKEMKKKNYFSHQSPSKGSLKDRLHDHGASFVQAGENIAAEYTDGIAATLGWLNSEGHRKNLLHDGFTHLGVGVYKHYYTQNFITPLSKK